MYEETKCAHEPCTCTAGEGGMKGEDGAVYCSAGCAKGEGCDCEECGCGGSASAEIAPGAVPPL